jgi:hypothetical protein
MFASSIPNEFNRFFSVDLILPAALGPWVDSASNRNEYQESSWVVKCGQCIRLTNLSPSVSRLSRQCGILNISQPCRPPQPVMVIVLLYFTLHTWICCTGWRRETEKFEVDVGSPVDVQ